MSKQVKVRIAVCVDPTGDWSSAGWKTTQEDELMGVAEEGVNNDGYTLYWVEATLDIPEHGKAVEGVAVPITQAKNARPYC